MKIVRLNSYIGSLNRNRDVKEHKKIYRWKSPKLRKVEKWSGQLEHN